MLALFEIGAKLIDKILPDTEARDKAKAKLAQMEVNGELTSLENKAKVIMAEANGESWLQRNWRPLTMITFTALVVTKWLGLSSPDISPEIEMKLFEIIQIGIGGYIVGRTGEKIMKQWKK